MILKIIHDSYYLFAINYCCRRKRLFILIFNSYI